MGGLWGKMPVFSVFFLFFALASMGLPGLNNFVGEILIWWASSRARPLIGILSFGGLVFGGDLYPADGQGRPVRRTEKDHVIGWISTLREGVILVIMALPILFIGLHPGPVLRLLDQPVQHLLTQFSVLAMGG